MNKFKKGDKVVVDEDFHEEEHRVIPNCFKVGVPYAVVQGDTPTRSVIKVEGSDTWWLKDRFKLYKETPRSCKFKPGNTYKTRDGREAIVYAVYPDTNQAFPVHGAYKDPDGHYISTCWTSEGRNIAYKMQDLQLNKRKVYINLRKTSSNMILVGHDRPYDTAEEAELGAARGVSAGNNYVAIAAPIEIEE